MDWKMFVPSVSCISEVLKRSSTRITAAIAIKAPAKRLNEKLVVCEIVIGNFVLSVVKLKNDHQTRANLIRRRAKCKEAYHAGLYWKVRKLLS
jgi:hypothetical protein